MDKKFTLKQVTPLVVMAVLYCVTLVISNILVNKSFVCLGYVASGSLMYPLILISSDIISECYGYHISRRVCWISIAMTLFASLSYTLVIALPTAEGFENIQESMKVLLGQNWMVWMFSTIAGYLSGLTNDVLFQKMKLKNPDSKKFWIRASISTTISVLVDCLVFFSGLYLFVIGLPFNVALKMLPSVFIYQVLLKAGSELVIGPVLNKFVVPKINKLIEE